MARNSGHNDYSEFADTSRYKIDINLLMNLVVAKIPGKWQNFGTQLKIDSGVLRGILVDISCGGKPTDHFRSVLEIWEKEKPLPFNWCTLLNVLTSHAISEISLAEKIVEELRKKCQVTEPSDSSCPGCQSAHEEEETDRGDNNDEMKDHQDMATSTPKGTNVSNKMQRSIERARRAGWHYFKYIVLPLGVILVLLSLLFFKDYGWWKWPATFLVAAAIHWMIYRDSQYIRAIFDKIPLAFLSAAINKRGTDKNFLSKENTDK